MYESFRSLFGRSELPVIVNEGIKSCQHPELSPYPRLALRPSAESYHSVVLCMATWQHPYIVHCRAVHSALLFLTVSKNDSFCMILIGGMIDIKTPISMAVGPGILTDWLLVSIKFISPTSQVTKLLISAASYADINTSLLPWNVSCSAAFSSWLPSAVNLSCTLTELR